MNTHFHTIQSGSGSQQTTCPECYSPTGVFTVQKDSPNKGREFESCRADDCKFFRWCDGEPSRKPSNNNSRNNTIDEINQKLDMVLEILDKHCK